MKRVLNLGQAQHSCEPLCGVLLFQGSIPLKLMPVEVRLEQ